MLSGFGPCPTEARWGDASALFRGCFIILLYSWALGHFQSDRAQQCLCSQKQRLCVLFKSVFTEKERSCALQARLFAAFVSWAGQSGSLPEILIPGKNTGVLVVEKPLSFESLRNTARNTVGVKVEISGWDSFYLLFQVSKTRSFKVFSKAFCRHWRWNELSVTPFRELLDDAAVCSAQTRPCAPVCFQPGSSSAPLPPLLFLLSAPLYSLYQNHLLSYIVSLPLVPATLHCSILGR